MSNRSDLIFMFSLNIENSDICLRDIKPGDLPQILRWYNDTVDFRYATGIERSLSLKELADRYSETAVCTNVFFVGIYVKSIDRMVGILKGSLKYKSANVLWISLIAIDTAFQNRGYGGIALDLLLNHIKSISSIKRAYLSVAEKNIQGRQFWRKHGFFELKLSKNRIRSQNRDQSVIIMQKSL